MNHLQTWTWIATLALLTSCATVSNRPELKKSPPRKTVTTKQTYPQKTKPLPPANTSVSSQPVISTPITTVAVASTARIEALKKEYNKNPQGIDALRTGLSQVSDQELQQITQDPDFGALRVYALFEMSNRFQAKGDTSSAVNSLEDVKRLVPGSSLSEEAQNKIENIKGVDQVNRDTIAAVLPLSGKSASQGEKALRALQMGLGFSVNDTNYKLKVIDSEGSATAAEAAFNKLVAESHPLAIVGPILSRTATAIADDCEKLHIPCISLSQKSQLTAHRNYVFSHSLNSEQMAKFLVDQAFQRGFKRFAILYPNDAYGVEYANAFWDEVLIRGGQVTAVQSYDSSDTDFRYVAQRLASSFYIEARKEEFTQKTKDAKKEISSTRENSSIDDILGPIVDFDAIFIPDSSKTMGQLGAFLSYVGIKKVTLLGTNLWNTPGLAKRAHQFKDNLLFADMYNPEDPSLKEIPFFKAYFEKYNEYPGTLEIHAYEVGQILRQALQRRVSSHREMLSYLGGIKEFPGVLGQLTMDKDRELGRPLSAYKIDKEEIVLAQ